MTEKGLKIWHFSKKFKAKSSVLNIFQKFLKKCSPPPFLLSYFDTKHLTRRIFILFKGGSQNFRPSQLQLKKNHRGIRKKMLGKVTYFQVWVASRFFLAKSRKTDEFRQLTYFLSYRLVHSAAAAAAKNKTGGSVISKDNIIVPYLWFLVIIKAA